MLETINGNYTIKQILKDNWQGFFEKYKDSPGIRFCLLADRLLLFGMLKRLWLAGILTRWVSLFMNVQSAGIGILFLILASPVSATPAEK